MKISLFIFLVLLALSCKQNPPATAVFNTEQNVETIATEKSIYSIPSEVIFHQAYEQDDTTLMFHLPYFDEIENLVDDSKKVGDGSVDYTPIDRQKLKKYINIDELDTMFFYDNASSVGNMKVLLAINKVTTPMDSYIGLSYGRDKFDKTYTYASNCPKLNPVCNFEIKEDMPRQYSKRVNESDAAQYLVSNDNSVKFFSKVSGQKSEVYYINFENTEELVYKAKSKNLIYDLQPLPIFSNNRPILFVGLGETDAEGALEQAMFVFDGKQYRRSIENKVRHHDLNIIVNE
jgi:hypothetical protein